MSFAAPLVLVGLVLLPLLGVAYAVHQRDRARAAAAFAAPHLRPSFAPRRPGWRRHIPLLAIALAIALLIVAAARPQTTVAVPVEHASIMLMTDVSGSMEATGRQADAPRRRAARRDDVRRRRAQGGQRRRHGVQPDRHGAAVADDRPAAREVGAGAA